MKMTLHAFDRCITCALLTIAAWQFTAGLALAVTDVRASDEAAYLYDLAVAESARSIDGAVELLKRAELALSGVRGMGDGAATSSGLAARIANTIRVLAERHDMLRQRRERAEALLNDDRPAAAWVLLDRLPTCSARAAEQQTLDVNPYRGGHCWPTADTHLDIRELERKALDAALTAERLVDEANGAARKCRAARQAIRGYITALSIDADLVGKVDPKIARARACLLRSPRRNRAAGLLTVAGFAAVLGIFHYLENPR